jgi:Histidine kinase
MRYFYLAFLFSISLQIKLSAQTFFPTHALLAQDLPFREVLASFETSDGVVWMVLPSHICRNNGHQLDCFPIKTQGVETAFMAENRYIIVHTLSKNNAAYFDTKTLEVMEFPWSDEYSLVYHHGYGESLMVTDYKKIYQYDFTSKKLVVNTTLCPFLLEVPNIKLRLQNGRFVQFLSDRIFLDGKLLPIPMSKSMEYGQAFSHEDNVIISNGETIFYRDKKNTEFLTLYSDDRFCKKMFSDQSGHFYLNIHKPDICKYTEQIKILNPEDHTMTDVPDLIPVEFDSTLAQLGGRDFTKKVLLSSYQGFKTLTTDQPAISKALTINKGTGFGRILKGITTDNRQNIWCAGEVRNLYRTDSEGKVDSFPIKLTLEDTTMNLSFSRNLIFDAKRNWLWNISGSYVKNESILYAWSILDKKVAFALPVPHRLWSMIQYDKYLLLATNKESILRFDTDTKKLDTLLTLDKSDALEARVLHLDGKVLYIGGKGGLWTYRMDTKQIKSVENVSEAQIYAQVKRVDNLSEAQIYAVQTDLKNIYLGTLEGLWVVNKKSMSIQKFTVDNGLSNNYITACFPINTHQVLVGTFKGINLIDLRYNLVTVYQTAEGLSDDECNFISHHQDENNILIGTINGLTILNKKQLSTIHQLKPSIYKTQNSSFDSVAIHYIAEGNKLIFNPGVQKMVIHLESPSQHPKVRYAYRFFDIDTTWISLTGTQLEILLAFQTLRLDMKCTDSNGVWSSDFTSYTIVIKDFWYNAPWFYFLLTCLVSGLIYLGLKVQQKKERAKRDVLNKLEAQANEYKLQSLQSQMNPHFLFNAMSAIQYLIHTKNVHKADDYLTSFALLIRMILESSKNKTWSLEEEIKMLKLYCALEKERFEENQIHVDITYEDIDTMEVKMMPMIIQPFVENVFNHAFQNIDFTPEIKIIFQENGDYLIITITDNGIGISNSNNQKSDFMKMKKSRGIEITKERILNFNQQNDKKIFLDVSHQFDDKAYPGTKVVIRYPIL